MENPTDIAVANILALPTGRPLRVGVDGRSASGTTTFADRLSERLRRAGRIVVRANIDDFHPPGHGCRSAQAITLPKSYFAEGYDYAAFRDLLLAPLDAGGNRRCRLSLHDSFSDTPINLPAVQIPEDSIVVIDGCFLLRPEFRRFWEFIIWLDVSFETMVERAAKRDIAWMPSEAAVRTRYHHRWIPLHKLYEDTGARSYADMIIDNEDFNSPRAVPVTCQIKRRR